MHIVLSIDEVRACGCLPSEEARCCCSSPGGVLLGGPAATPPFLAAVRRASRTQAMMGGEGRVSLLRGGRRGLR